MAQIDTNKNFITGRLTKDARYFAPKSAEKKNGVARYTIAVNQIAGKGEDGKLQTRTEYFDCVQFGCSENLAKCLTKGASVLVEGQLGVEDTEVLMCVKNKDGNYEYIKDKDGKCVTMKKVVIHVDNLQLIGSKNANGAPASSETPASPSAPATPAAPAAPHAPVTADSADIPF